MGNTARLKRRVLALARVRKNVIHPLLRRATDMQSAFGRQ